jgi:hypothetical protein
MHTPYLILAILHVPLVDVLLPQTGGGELPISAVAFEQQSFTTLNSQKRVADAVTVGSFRFQRGADLHVLAGEDRVAATQSRKCSKIIGTWIVRVRRYRL